MIYVISDLHGYPLERFQKLLEQAGFGKSDFLYILGDVVDRNGDGGVAMLDWLMYQNNIQLILGNHEAALLACAFVFDELTEDSVEDLTAEKIDHLTRYQTDGGEVTLAAMQALPKDTQQDILDYLRDCPYYETVSAGGRDYILVHAGYENFDPKKRIEDYAPDELMWKSPKMGDTYYTKVITVFGHNPTRSFGKKYKGQIFYTDTWIDIDAGAAYGEQPVLLRLDDMKEFRLEEEE